MKAWVVCDASGRELAAFDTEDAAAAWPADGGLRLSDVWGGGSTAWVNYRFQLVAVLSKRKDPT